MNRTLKALGLGLLAALAMSAFFAIGAAADPNKHTGGHFTNDAFDGHALLHGKNDGDHQITLTASGRTVNCAETYTGTMSAATMESIIISPHYTSCESEGSEVTVNMNGCTYVFTVRDTDASTKHSPVHLVCPTKPAEVIQHGACNITFGSQEITTGVVYKTITVNKKHAITADITAKEIKYEKHGLCIFVAPGGTGPHSGANGASMTGSATITATDTAGNPVNITATGTNGH